MALVAGAVGNLAPKLLQLLQDEYKLQKGTKAQVESLAKELEAMHAALCQVAEVPYDQLNPQVKLWASQAREASYDMEDILDTFLVRVDGCHQPNAVDKGKVRRLIKKMHKKFSLSSLKTRHDVAGAIEDIKKHVDEMIKRRDRYKVDDVLAKSATTTSIDPRILMTLCTKASDLVGIGESKDALIKMLALGDDDAPDKKMKIVSIVGFGGLGKTTLAKVVYDELFTVNTNISCKAFVPVGRNPDLKKVLRDILIGLDKEQYMNKTNLNILDERQLIEEIQSFLKQKRYFIVIDDIWDVPSWKVIRTALQDNNLGSKIMITTRHSDVAELAHCTYEIQPLCPDGSKILFYGRIFGSQDKCPDIFSELSDKILKKCGGVPLAIITIASLLANKVEDITEWQEVCSSIGFGLGSSNDMRKILSRSYYDLPSHMKICFLYLSMYPKDYKIDRDQLIWRWICEGFIIPQRKGDDLFELGKSYFNELINRRLVQPLGVGNTFCRVGDEIYSCRVHDMIHDLICSLSKEENFVTTLDDIEKIVMSSESKKIRRLSLRNITWPKNGVAQVRSIFVFGSCIHSISSFSCLGMLRVLDLEGCFLEDCGDSNKLSVGNLIHLRYLGLSHTNIKVLPGGIEMLKFLLVLKIVGDIKLPELPESSFGLRQLMCLQGVRCCPRPGNLLRNLASLQVLEKLYLDKEPAITVEALGHLTQLTKLAIEIEVEMMDQSICDAFINSLCKLARLQILEVSQCGDNLINWECWTPPPCLHKVRHIFSWRLPKWISHEWVPHLTTLAITVDTVRPGDIQILGMLPKLVDLWLSADHQNFLEQPLQKFMVSAGAFPCLRACRFFSVLTVPNVFALGAMPQLQVIHFCLRARDFFSNPPSKGFDLDDLAMDHLPSLRDVDCYIYTESDISEEEVNKLGEAVKRAADGHPNHPRLSLHVLHTPAPYEEVTSPRRK